MTVPLRVLHVVRPAEGGIRQHVISLISRATHVRHALAGPEAFLKSLPSLPITQSYALAIAPRFALKEDWLAAKALSALTAQYDVIHAHGLRAGWIASLAALRRPFPLVVTAHNLSDAGGLLAVWGLRLIGRKADVVIAVSDAVGKSLTSRGVPAAKIRIIPNGIDIAHFEEAVPPLAVKQNFTVGCIARLSPEKGVDVLLQAAAGLPDVAFLIAGDGPLRKQLQVRCPDNARFVGRIVDTRTLLASVDVLAVPSRAEGQGIVALEGMAAGVPIIASRVGGLGEMLTDGETALLVPASEPAALAEAIRHLQGNTVLREHLVCQGRLLVRERYDVLRMAEAITALYESVRR